MKLFMCEVRKILTPANVLILLALIIVNPVIALYTVHKNSTFTYTPAEYKKEFSHLLPEGEGALDILNKEIAHAGPGTGSLYRDLRKDLSDVYTYSDYLQGIQNRAGEISALGSVRGETGFSVRNAEKTAKVYSRLEGCRPQVMISRGITMITDSEVTDYIGIIIILVLSLMSVFQEREHDQFGLMRTAVHGRRDIMAAKCMSVAVLTVLSELLLCAGSAVTGLCLYGPTALSSCIQSLSGFRQSPFRLHVWSYILIYILIKCAVFITIAMVMMWLCGRCRKLTEVILVSAGFLAAEAALCAFIPASSFLALLKYVNVTYFMKVSPLFRRYYNCSIFGYPVNLWWFFTVCTLVILIVAVISVIRLLDDDRAEVAGGAHSGRVLFSGHPGTGLFSHECFKTFLLGGALWFILLAALWDTAGFRPLHRQYDDMVQVYYEEIMQSYQGPWSAEKDAVLISESGTAEPYLQDSDGSRQEACARAADHSRYLSRHKGSWFLPDRGYRLLTGNDGGELQDRINGLFLMILLILVTSGIQGLDYRHDEYRLVRSTRRGRMGTEVRRQLLGLIMVLISLILVYLPYYANVLHAYGTDNIHAPACSMEHLAGIPAPVTVLGYLIMVMLMRVAGSIIAVEFIFFTIRHCGSNTRAVLADVVVLVFPMILTLMDVPGSQYILLCPLVVGNIF